MAAAVLRAFRDAEGQAMDIDGVANGHVVHPLLKALKEILDVNGTTEVPVSPLPRSFGFQETMKEILDVNGSTEVLWGPSPPGPLVF